MSEANELTHDSAEKAYAAAAAGAARVPSTVETADEPLAFPSKVKRERKADAAASLPPHPSDAEKTDTAPAQAAPAEIAAPAAKAPRLRPAAAKPKIPRTRRVASPADRPVAAANQPKVLAKKPQTPRSKTNKSPVLKLEEKIMIDNDQTETADRLKDVIADVQSKAKEAFEKSTAAFGEAGEFAKGNVEAFVESGKILAAGLQDLSASTIADARSAFETLTADAKELAAARTPVEFFKLQAEIARKQFDSAVAQGSKSSEAWLKLASDAFAPLSGRVSHAVERIKQVA